MCAVPLQGLQLRRKEAAAALSATGRFVKQQSAPVTLPRVTAPSDRSGMHVSFNSAPSCGQCALVDAVNSPSVQVQSPLAHMPAADSTYCWPSPVVYYCDFCVLLCTGAITYGLASILLITPLLGLLAVQLPLQVRDSITFVQQRL